MALDEFQTEVLTTLGELKATCARTEANVEALAGEHGRVTMLEAAQKRQFWYTTAVVPVLAGLHAALRKFGVEM